jgi:plasmid stabilization system protein ParE
MSKTLEELAVELWDAKNAENAAKNLRILAEEAIAALVETPECGSKTVEAGDDLKVCVKRGLSFKADVDAIRALAEEIGSDDLPLTLTPPIPAGYAFDEKAYQTLKDEKPEVFRIVSKYVETKPKKTAVELKLK